MMESHIGAVCHHIFMCSPKCITCIIFKVLINLCQNDLGPAIDLCELLEKHTSHKVTKV